MEQWSSNDTEVDKVSRQKLTDKTIFLIVSDTGINQIY